MIARLSITLALLVRTADAIATPPTIRTLEAPTRIEAVANTAPAGSAAADYLQVALIDEATGRVGAPVFGTYSHEKNQLVFRPRFALAPGALYRVTAGAEWIDHRVPLPAAPAVATTVTAVIPSGGTVPANLLKFYLHFSRPMREGREVFEHIHLLDAQDQPIPAPWRDTELWTEDARRLTLWIHPGRVKRGVNLREEIGPVLAPLSGYTLLVDAALRDSVGQPLGKEFRLTFRTTDELHALLDLALWNVEIPKIGSREPFRAVSPVPLDAVIAQRALHLRDAFGTAVAGSGSLAPDARTWTFVPRDPWSAESYRWTADPWLEDLAGNTFVRIFDDDLDAAKATSLPSRERSFTCGRESSVRR